MGVPITVTFPPPFDTVAKQHTITASYSGKSFTVAVNKLRVRIWGGGVAKG